MRFFFQVVCFFRSSVLFFGRTWRSSQHVATPGMIDGTEAGAGWEPMMRRPLGNDWRCNGNG